MEEVAKRDLFKSRIHEIDFARGLLMCLVILDHLFNLLRSFNGTWAGDAQTQPFYTIYQIANFYMTFPARTPIRWLCLGLFCFISGISCAFSKNNWKRAGEMIGVWFLVLIVTNFLEATRVATGWDLGVKSLRVDFNILGVLAWSTLLYCFVQDKSWKALVIFIAIGLALHPICVILSGTEWGKHAYALPLWRPADELGFQADYMPLFPYLSFFFGGALLSYFTYGVNKKSYFKAHEWERPICFVGRHSLIIYGAHFLLLIAIFSLIGVFIK